MKSPFCLYFFPSTHSSKFIGLQLYPRCWGRLRGDTGGHDLLVRFRGVHIWGRRSDPGQAVISVWSDRRCSVGALGAYPRAPDLFWGRGWGFLSGSVHSNLHSSWVCFPTGRLEHPISGGFPDRVPWQNQLMPWLELSHLNVTCTPVSLTCVSVFTCEGREQILFILVFS